MMKAIQYKAGKTGFGEGLVEAGRHNHNVIGLGADITTSVGMNFFAEAFPERFFSMGIAEQNCIGVAAGMALAGKIPVFSTYGVFAALRTADHIRISLCYNNLRVVIGGAHAGISVGPDGATHQALEDIAVMRVLPNMTVISPCDATQTRLATIAAIEQVKGPVYLRFGREPVPDFSSPDQLFTIGKGEMLRSGNDLTIIATGHLVWESLLAAEKLAADGISARVINLHTIKPVDEEIIVKAASETGLIITAEEHQIIGGLGSTVAEIVTRHHPVPVGMVGMNDHFGESGRPEELITIYGLNAAGICTKAYQFLNKKL
ncbi:MAG TPA: transketolase [Bacteroidales bacterium]|nr:MAG: transketolase [Bacteroidetes bacterium GWE2_42_24]OFY31609.1 MAG: transketolase [Bacteroidetes bacterium GWF2_43_11]HAQ64416.1 transketolase [Bacteroidales bacterium]HBZ67134.1 transketolase [Bacteroidales bacterium]